MTKITMGILMCTLFFSSKMVTAEESAERLKDINKAVSAQLLRLKQKKMEAKLDTETSKKKKGEDYKLLSKNKTSSNDLQKKKLEVNKTAQQPVEDASKTPSILPTSKSLTPSNNKIIKKSVKLKTNKNPQTNLQKNDLLRQKIQSIVNTEPN